MTSQHIGNAIGEQDLPTAKNYLRSSIGNGVVVSALEVVAVYTFRTSIIGIYNSSEEVYTTTVILLMMYLAIIPGDILQMTIIAILKAIGREKIATLMFLVISYVVGIPLGCILGIRFEIESRGILIGLGTAIYLLLIASVVTLLRTDMRKEAEKIFKTRTQQ